VEPENARALFDAIVAVRADGAARRMMARNARAYARSHWSRERILHGMEAALAGVVRVDEERQPMARDGASSELG
jgi:hypothetical protein